MIKLLKFILSLFGIQLGGREEDGKDSGGSGNGDEEQDNNGSDNGGDNVDNGDNGGDHNGEDEYNYDYPTVFISNISGLEQINPTLYKVIDKPNKDPNSPDLNSIWLVK